MQAWTDNGITINETGRRELHRMLGLSLQAIKEGWRIKINNDIPRKLWDRITDKVVAGRLPTLDDDSVISSSSACTPAADGIWSIGFLGSVWLDIKVAGKLYRAYLNPTDARIYVDPLE